jgi:peptide/nickel transport system substrate-binding protein
MKSKGNSIMKTGMVIVAVALFLLAGCTTGGSSAPQGEEPGADAGAAEGDAPASALRVALDAEPTSLDPNTSNGWGTMFITQSVFDPIWSYTVDGEFRYGVAEKHEFTQPDELTVNIRKDAKFANGDPITAEDVLYTLQYNSTQVGAVRMMSVDVENSKAVDDSTLVIKLKMPDPLVVENLSMTYVLSKKHCEAGGEQAIAKDVLASGAYSVGDWTPGVSITLTKNDTYYDAANVKYDTIEVSYFPEETTRMLEFEGGNYDIAYLSSSDNVSKIMDGGVEGATVYQARTQNVNGFVMDTVDTDKFADQNIRLAVAHAIDVPTMIQEICGPLYTVGKSILPSANYAFKDEGGYEYDPELSKDYLKKAGYEPGEFEFTCRAPDQANNKQLAEAAQAYLADVGITMNVDIGDASTVMNEIIQNKIEFGFSSYIGSYDPAGVLNSRSSTAPANMSKFADPEIQKLLDDAAASTEGEEVRKGMYADLQDKAQEYCSFIPLYEVPVFYGVRDTVGSDLGQSVTADGFLYGTYIK